MKTSGVSEPSAATSTNCHSPHRRVNQEFPILPCEPGASLRTTVKEEREEEEEIKTAELFSLALSSVYLTESVNHMTESFVLGPAHQVENREGPRCQSSQWVRMRLSRHLVAPAALSSRGSLRTSSSCCSLTDPHRRLSGRTNKIENEKIVRLHIFLSRSLTLLSFTKHATNI